MRIEYYFRYRRFILSVFPKEDDPIVILGLERTNPFTTTASATSISPPPAQLKWETVTGTASCNS